ncbi:MAG: DNA polymerase III subunit epsilon, partial [Robiginitomaculum sp.]|nr:DNA polymerase III subunit epsilon [Robiginitomaculum sp.]
RMEISLEGRAFHGALLDAQLLARVYLELNGGRETVLDFSCGEEGDQTTEFSWTKRTPRQTPLASRVQDAEQQAHITLLNELGDAAIWHRYIKP